MADTTFDALTEESTPDDIAAAVDEIVAEAEADREGDATEEKSDAQITSEHAENEFTADGKPDNVLSEGEKSGKNKPSRSEDWREEAVAEASAYGFSEEDIAEFGSREELDRALKLVERQLQTERDKLEEEDGGEQEKGQARKPAEGRYEVGLSKDVYDDDLVDELTRMRDHYEARVAALEERFKKEEAFAAEERFDRTVDDLGFAELFGKTGEETDKELARRKDLYQMVQVEQQVLAKLGRTAGDYGALVQRVARSLFAEEYDKKLIKNHTRRISRQSNARQGGGATRATDPPESPRDEADRLYREMAQV